MSKLTTAMFVIIVFTIACARDAGKLECSVNKIGIANAPIKGDGMNDQRITLAIDGSPTAVTADIAEILANKRVGATFFAVGRQVPDHREELLYVRDAGHLIGNATFSGKRLTASKLPVGEMRKADAVLTPYVVGDMFLLRVPEDDFNADLATYLNRQGLQKYVGPIGADIIAENGEAIDLGCWRERLTPGECSVRYLESLADKKKGIVRFTDGYAELVGLLQELLPALSTAGFEFVRLDAVPEIRRRLQERGAKIDQVAGEGGCSDYGVSS